MDDSVGLVDGRGWGDAEATGGVHAADIEPTAVGWGGRAAEEDTDDTDAAERDDSRDPTTVGRCRNQPLAPPQTLPERRRAHAEFSPRRPSSLLR